MTAAVLWLNPIALAGLAAVVAPVLIHLLVWRRAERLPFPTLRFLRPTRFASLGRRALDDPALLAVRAAILAAAALALAGPLIVTRGTRAEWDRRIARAIVRDEAAPVESAGRPTGATFSETFTASNVRAGIDRAVSWLDSAPPARRELVVSSPFPLGSVNPSILQRVPPDVGVQLVRAGALPRRRNVPGGRVLTSAGAVDREVLLDAAATSVRERPARDAPGLAVDIVASVADRSTVDAAAAAAVADRVWAAAPGRRAQLLVLPAGAARPEFTVALTSASAIRTPWIANAVAWIGADADVQAASRRVPRGISDPRLLARPWEPVSSAADGRPLVVSAAADDRLLVASGAPAVDIATPILIRAIANALADPPDWDLLEIVPIGDADLRAWSRPSSPAAPRLRTVEEDDRRFAWGAALVLLALESWMRVSSRRGSTATEREAPRVA